MLVQFWLIDIGSNEECMNAWWLHDGCMVVAWWMHGGCMVDAWWMHGGCMVVAW